MEEYAVYPPADAGRHTAIPWLNRWDRRTERKADVIECDRQTRLFNIDYMNMLEELEFK